MIYFLQFELMNRNYMKVQKFKIIGETQRVERLMFTSNSLASFYPSIYPIEQDLSFKFVWKFWKFQSPQKPINFKYHSIEFQVNPFNHFHFHCHQTRRLIFYFQALKGYMFHYLYYDLLLLVIKVIHVPFWISGFQTQPHLLFRIMRSHQRGSKILLRLFLLFLYFR